MKRPGTTAATLLMLVLACGQADGPLPDLASAPGPVVQGSWPAPNGPCALGPAHPTRLLLTTTDYSTGAVTVVDTASRQITADVAVGSTDAIPFHDAAAGRIVLVHRFGLDYLDVLDEATFAPQGQFPILAAGSANPQSLAFDSSGDAWLTTLGTPRVRRVDLAQAPAHAEVDTVDLSAFADSDGNPEAGVIVACGEQLYVGVQRLDASFAPVDVDMLVPVDRDTNLPVDLDADTPGGQGLALHGTWLRQLRTDPLDPSGTTLLALTSGIERIDTVRGTVTWAVPEARLGTADHDRFRLPQAFAVAPDGRTAYVAAYVEDFSEVQLYVVGLDGHPPQQPEPFASGMDSVERTLELVGDTLWYGSTRRDAPGLWVFDVGASPPTVVAGPLPTGLPPYSMVALP